MSAGMTPSSSDAVTAAILHLTAARGPAGSVGPEEVARAVAPGDGAQWRSELGAVRREAVRLARDGRIDILRKGKPVDPAQDVRGVIRLRARPAAEPAADPGSAP